MPILLFPDPKLLYTVVTNASGTTIGGFLMQNQGNGLEPLAFLSRRLKPMEQRYSALVKIGLFYPWGKIGIKGCIKY